MKIAIVHDFLKEYGGAERVVEALHEIWPEAPIYTAFVDYSRLGPHGERIEKWDIRPSWVQKNWFVKKFHSPLRFLAPQIWESFDFTGYDVVISSASWYITKGIKVPENCMHICYLHTVPRALYGYETALNWKKHLLIRIYGTIVNHYLRMYDFKAAQKVDYFIANSEETKRRIEKFYRKDATVIYPPVNLIAETQNSKLKVPSRFAQGKQNQNSNLKTEKGYYLTVSRLAGAKHIELAVKTANKMKFPLCVVGKGPEESYLKSIAGGTVKFFGEVSDEQLAELYNGCKAFVFCAIDEDFGIVPVEAMGFGKPVIAFRGGGVLETVMEGATGTFFDHLTEESLEAAIYRLEGMNIDSEACRKKAEEFSKERFKERIKEFLKEKIDKKTVI